MPKKKTYVEELLSEFRKSQKMAREAVSKLESRVSSRENRIKFLENELESQKASYESRFQEILGTDYEHYIVGYNFEKHVVWWMNQYRSDYELKIWQGDKCIQPYEDDFKIYASWNKYPDLIYVNEKAKKVVALECKYRFDGKLTIDEKKYEDYKKFETQIGALMNVDAKVYIMAGCLGDNGGRPDFMYCIPIDYFETHTNIDFRDTPQFMVMERDYYQTNISNLAENCPF